MSGIDLAGLLQDLDAETEVVHEVLLGLSASEWSLPTPAVGWDIRDQVSHLAFFDESAVLAVTEPDRFRAEAKSLLGLGPDFPDRVAERFRDMPVDDLADWFRRSRSELLDTFAELDGSARVPWFGPDMSVASSATARLMETWAHGRDIADTFGIECVASGRLRHIAHLGHRTLGFSFALRGRPVPETPVRVVLSAPDGGTWEWGPQEASNTVFGTALDFCLVVTQRRHLLDTDLAVTGTVAREWMSIAQTFAGAPGSGREPDHNIVKEL